MQAWCLRFSPALEKRAGGLSEVTGYRVASCLSNQRPSHRNQKWVDDITGAGEGLKRRPSPASPSRCRLPHSCLPWQRKIQAISQNRFSREFREWTRIWSSSIRVLRVDSRPKFVGLYFATLRSLESMVCL